MLILIAQFIMAEGKFDDAQCSLNGRKSTEVDFQLPPFGKANLICVEAWFRSYRVTKDNAKFEKEVNERDPDILGQGADIIEASRNTEKYRAIKGRIINAYAVSKEVQLHELLTGLLRGAFAASSRNETKTW